MKSLPDCQVMELARVFDYSEFKALVEECARLNMTTGESTPERIEATRLNAHRMARVEKTLVIRPELSDLIRQIHRRTKWIVLAEAWCGDGAQTIPVIAKLAELNPLIELNIVLRDENPELMNEHMTNGTRSVPKLISIDCQTGKETGTWGPRPERIAQMGVQLKQQQPGISHDEFVKNLHLWYGRDRNAAIQEDFIKNPFFLYNHPKS